MDFWLSFLAVVSTFIYLTNISETAKRTIHTLAAIITALLAISGATRYSQDWKLFMALDGLFSKIMVYLTTL
jgi:hypothetical protein